MHGSSFQVAGALARRRGAIGSVCYQNVSKNQCVSIFSPVHLVKALFGCIPSTAHIF